MDGRISFLRDTKRVGDIAEIRIAGALVEAGYRIFFPFGENHRYDLLAEDGEGRFFRIQVKAGRIRNGALHFNCYSSHSHRNGISNRRYIGEIDYFGVWCADNATAYLISIDDVGVVGCLRVSPPKNGQRRKVRWAHGYQIPLSGTKVVGPEGARGVSLPGLLPS